MHFLLFSFLHKVDMSPIPIITFQKQVSDISDEEFKKISLETSDPSKYWSLKCDLYFK